MMTAKKKIITKLRTARAAEISLPRVGSDDNIFADYPRSEAGNLISIFKNNMKKLSGEFFMVNSFTEAAETIETLLQSAEGTKFCADFSPLCRKIFTAYPRLAGRFENASQQRLNSVDFAGFAVGLTSADFLVARTGSVLLRSLAAGGRRLSVLPPMHIVIATTAQLLPSLDEALHSVQFQNADWRYATIITGPSRTSDIEKILVLGAHGPKRLAVILVEGETIK